MNSSSGRLAVAPETPRRDVDAPRTGPAPLVALLLLVIVGMRQEINQALTLGDVAAVALSPVWLFSLRQFRGARSYTALGVAALCLGLLLSGFSTADHGFDRISYFNNSVVFSSLFLAVGAVLWARTLMPGWLVGLGYGAGLALGVSATGRAAENLWKFGYSIPVTVLVLSLAIYACRRWALNPRWTDMLLLAGLALWSGAHDARSLFGLLLLAFTLVTWQLIPQGRTVRRSIARTLLAFVTMIIVTYNVATGLLVDGYLGEVAQQRSSEQIALTGSLLVGARPEMAATIALFQHQPWGFGVGITPSLQDILAAKTGMARINYQPNNGYVENYMLGTHFELHSVLGDFWVSFGLAGAAVALVTIAMMIRWIVTAVAGRRASGLVLFLAVISLWNLLFSPMYTSMPILALAVGLVLARAPRTAPQRAADVAASPAPGPRGTTTSGQPSTQR
ncbi:oligosaccharide repeat unit polymerase [Arthrobacter oryzae]|uniref:O-antigen ligase n=1 Tax=Arthrobacter oryzae TaxID=409290 RepID=A0A3N0C128_9MICC|nr:oligosaccharide repeat unit polymerase [Arthrobacter oryzae]RNL55440.1 hypothetical protein D7003_09930 [Arthrobacter oryzae]